LIPNAYIQAWRAWAPWPDTRQVEQDLIICRALPFSVDSEWYQGKTETASFTLEEMFGTKLRALLQRNKNRDLFDLYQGMEQLALDPDKLIACFDHYLALEGRPITRAVAEQRMLEKLTRSLTEDIAPLLPAEVRFDDNDAMLAFERVWTDLISRVRGDAWKLTDKALEELRSKKYPNLLRS
jgi:predicted nucleotidyltransferase component of viral defense system